MASDHCEALTSETTENKSEYHNHTPLANKAEVELLCRESVELAVGE